MSLQTDVRERHLRMMAKTGAVLQNIVSNLEPGRATSLRDGPQGWNTVEILCHLRDFDTIFRERAELMLKQDSPALPAYDHEALVIERAYAKQKLDMVLAELVASRQKSQAFFEALTEAQWDRPGQHAERGQITLNDIAVQFGTHDLDHIEQITRILSAAA